MINEQVEEVSIESKDSLQSYEQSLLYSNEEKHSQQVLETIKQEYSQVQAAYLE
ncbi:hypothetical protein A5844_000499 [Enterococcus sp. 10A9_DIV0425]|uniref:Uncharacterized protein n=1 Tax=Candidatus Enterococcus wittei TaxID=1987383 RepID=A0A2C9XRC3_9ENTE|nr:hypothetical protein [Enterococcus sp. 10A9_DIV0425]OTP12267.1 hypothetical protein A5844_000499 [Enterococcus sp. 10A9_DIV0425]